MNILLADIGATKTRFAKSDGKRIGRIITFATQSKWSNAQKTMAVVLHELFGATRITRSVIGIPGQLDPQHVKIVSAGNLKNWVQKPIAEWFHTRSTKVVLENDVVLSGVGEALSGAGKGKQIVGFVTVSTGVNGVRIVAGEPDARAFASELRHIIVPFRGKMQPIEQAIGGRALEKRHGVDGSAIRSPSIWREVERTLAIGLVNLELAWAPDIMILGGALMRSISISAVRTAMQKQWHHHAKMPKLVQASLGDHSGLYGGLALVRRSA